jgi:hypothetical protein
MQQQQIHEFNDINSVIYVKYKTLSGIAYKQRVFGEIKVVCIEIKT